MRIFSVRQKIRALIVLIIISAASYASISGPEPRHTGAPGDLGNCTICHDDNNANTGSGSVSLNLSSITSGVYEPDKKYRLIVTVRQNNRQRYGFQLTAIDKNGNRAGTFQPVGSDTQVNPLTGAGGRQYIQHRDAGTLPNGSGQRTWQVDWTAPQTDVGTVRFYFAGNAANGSGTNRGDFIYTANAISESETTVVNLGLTSQPTDMTLEAGSKFLITWTATNPSNIDSFELRYSTDDGKTFPISNLIFSTTEADTTDFEWTVPDKQTSQARLRLIAATKAGVAVQLLSGKFSINGTGGTPLPKITGVSITGKKLFIDGENFQAGAKVFLDGVSQKTNNEADASHRLRCKKSGNKLISGVPAMLKVVNPDGTESPTFEYTRP